MDNWKNILDSESLKTNIIFSMLFVMNYECLKDFLIEQVRDFYTNSYHFDGEKIVGEESYEFKENVRSLTADKHLENASLKWFIKQDALKQEDYEVFQKLRKRRDEITHELLYNLNSGYTSEDVFLFGEILRIYNTLDKWWINEIEIPLSEKAIPENYDREGVCGSQALVLSIVNNIALGIEEEKYRKWLEELIKNGLA